VALEFILAVEGSMRVRLVILAVVVVLGGALVGSPAVAAPGTAPPSFTIFAASDLAFAFREMIPRFEQAAGVKVTLVLGSTGNLAKQIEHGAPADVLFAANQTFVDDLLAKGAVIAETRALYAQGRIVLATARTAGPRLTALMQLRDPRIRRVAIANPAHAPYGRAAEEALRSAGIWDAVKPKLVYGENIRQALQFMESGAAEAGILALSIASAPAVDWVPIDPAMHGRLDQAVAVVRRSPRPELGVAFIQFVNGPEGRAIMKRYGFLLPGEF
jgi:molybdate transport system substrate-binding protein